MILRDLLDTTPRDLATFFQACFVGYVVEVRFDAATFAERMRMDGVDLAHSRMIVVDDVAVGLMLVSRRGTATRLAAMGMVESARGQGFGGDALQLLLQEARERGDREMWLEVIEQNPPAVRLYRNAGFEVRRRFVGFFAPAATGGRAGLQPVEPREFLATLARHGGGDLPWQAKPESLAWLGRPYAAYRLGPAWAMVSDPSKDTVVVKSLVVETGERRRGHGVALLSALRENIAGSLRAPAICPEDSTGPLFHAAGWTRDKLSQFEMSLRWGAA